MDKDEILEKAREENEGYADERELAIRAKASQKAFAVGLVLCCLIFLLQTFFGDGMDTSTEAVWGTMLAVKCWYEYAHMQIEKIELVLGILVTIGSAFMLVYFILTTFGIVS